MKTGSTSTRALFLGLFFMLATGSAHADVTLPIVGHLDRVDKKLWKKSFWHKRLKRWKIPEALLDTATLPTPSRAYQAPYTNIFLQNERVVICLDSCKGPQNLVAIETGENSYRIDGNGDSLANVVRQTNVYYWTNRFFDRMQELGFTPQKRLVVLVDRKVPDETSGESSSNNAFFNNYDWSLSFLPSSVSLLSRIAMQTAFSYSANDPSVVMHEAAHSVFESLIGPILNPEIYGLHEAFADYLSLAIIGEPELGKVMLEGKALRSASKILEYKTGMEAHDLGNVVVSALWNIRKLFTDFTVADRIALETVRRIGANPYHSAGDIVAAHLTLLRETAGLDPEISRAAEAIWKQTKLTPTEVKLDSSALIGAESRDPPVLRTRITTTFPSSLVENYGYPEKTEGYVSYFKTLKTDVPEQSWYQLSVSSTEKPNESLWVYRDRNVGSIYGAYTLGGEAIADSRHPRYPEVSMISSTMNAMINLVEGTFAEPVLIFFRPEDIEQIKDLYKVGPVRTVTETVLINGYPLEVETRSVDVEPSEWAQLLELIDGEVSGIVRAVKNVSLRVIVSGTPPSSNIPLPKAPDGKPIIGYSLTMGSGITLQSNIIELR